MKIISFFNNRKELIKSLILKLLLLAAIGIVIWLIFISISTYTTKLPDIPEKQNNQLDSVPVESIESLPLVDSKAYYGSSDFGECNTNNDCVVTGCNAEVCGAKSEEGEPPAFATICIFPDEPLPKELGYECGCNSNNECEWQL